jgi:adenylate cyclase
MNPLAIPLEKLERCFQAVIPGMLTTASRDGEPNMIAVSFVHRLDERHVAISRQFFRKTHANLRENPRAQVAVMDPATMDTYRLGLRFDHEESSGPLFDFMSTRIDAAASMTGMKGVFRLQAADVFEVLAVEHVPGIFKTTKAPDATTASPLASIDALTQLRLLRRISDTACSTQDAETLLDSVLGVLDEVLGFEHSMILMLDETEERLFTIASRGYPESGIGAEVRVGDGVIGTVAQKRRLLRVSSLQRARIYAEAIRTSVDSTPHAEIPLPGLPNAESQLAIPLLVKEELLGVLAVESPSQIRYGEREEAFLEVVAGHVALALRNAMPIEETRPQEMAPAKAPRHFVFYPNDDCVFVDGNYLIRNIPGRILWKLLEAHVNAGRSEFTNRELRLDSSLGLPALRTNLESRLILLKKRLAERCPELKIVPSGRGRFTLELGCAVTLEVKR